MLPLSKINEYILLILIFLYPSLALTVGVGRTTIFILMIVFGWIYFFQHRSRREQLTSSDGYLVFGWLFFYFSCLLAYYTGGMSDSGDTRMGRLLVFFLAPLLFFSLKHIRIPPRLVWLSFIVASLVLGVIAILQNYEIDLLNSGVYGRGDFGSRVGGIYNPMRFGAIALVIGFFSMAWVLTTTNPSKLDKWLSVIGFIVACMASILSGTRGAWIAIPLLVILCLYLSRRQITEHLRRRWLFWLIPVCLIVATLGHYIVRDRLQQAVNDIQAYRAGNAYTSIGYRLEFFRAAIHMIKENPFLGVGEGNFRQEYRNLTEKLQLADRAYTPKNPHNEYLLVWSTRGVVGFLALWVMLTSLISVFWKANLIDSDNRFYALCGMILIVGYMQFGFSMALFEHKVISVFFLIYTSLFASQLSRKVPDG